MLLLSPMSVLKHDLHLVHMQLNTGQSPSQERTREIKDPLVPMAHFRSLKCLLWEPQCQPSEWPESNTDAKAIKRRDEKERKGANMNPGPGSPREHLPPPRQELPSAKEQLQYAGPDL